MTTIVLHVSGCDPVEVNLADFLRTNVDGIGDHAEAIRVAMARGKIYCGGGGASAEWAIWPVTGK